MRPIQSAGKELKQKRMFSRWRPISEKKNIDHHNGSQNPSICHLPNLPYFSLPVPLKVPKQEIFEAYMGG
jgi:hypothetical protein